MNIKTGPADNIHPELSSTLKLLLLFSFLFFLTILITTAWVTEDAFITFRSVHNFLNGEGLTWNLGERVQVFTHPLWFFFIAGFSFITREFYYTVLILSFLFCFLLIYFLYRITPNKLTFFFLMILFPLSKAFMDYSTSGLENPLSHLLLLVFYVLFIGHLPGKSRVFYLFLIGSLILLCRMDLILLVLPPLAYELFKNKRLIVFAFLGLLPFLLWELFSLFYFGSLFPNTAYAKLNTGISAPELFAQGLYYFYHSLKLDPVTVVIILAGVIISLAKKQNMLFAAGMLLYIVYLIKIGGDFHSGRFLSPLFLTSIIVLSLVQMKLDYTFIILLFLAILLNIISPFPFYSNNAGYGADISVYKTIFSDKVTVRINDNGISDERSSLFRYTGLLNNLTERKLYSHPWVQNGKAEGMKNEKVIVRNNIGLFGFFTDPHLYLVDPYALTDPLLSRLPATEYWRIGHKWNGVDKIWRIGHFARKIPDGYIYALETNDLSQMHPALKMYYEKIRLITRGELFNSRRITEIIRMNMGSYDNLLNIYLNHQKVNYK